MSKSEENTAELDRNFTFRYVKVEYSHIIVYSCPNNIHVILSKAKDHEFLKRKGVVKKNEAFLRMESCDISLPFKFKFIEVVDNMPYLAVILKLKD